MSTQNTVQNTNNKQEKESNLFVYQENNNGEFKNISAVVKWFNATKGFGFALLENSMGDAFIHSSVLEQGGYMHLEEGDNLKIDIIQGDRGFQVSNIISVSPKVAEENIKNELDTLPTKNGIVKWFNNSKGYGFVAPESGGADIFIHASALERSGVKYLNENTPVKITVKAGKKGEEVDRIILE